MFKQIAIIGAAISLIGPSTAGATNMSQRQKITISLKTANGTGCPRGTGVTARASESDPTKFNVAYGSFEARGGSAKNCQLVLSVNVPGGMTYAIREIANGGNASLKSGASGKQVFTSYFTGESPTMKSQHSFRGPHRKPWKSTDVISPKDLSWAPCDKQRFLNINNVLRVAGASTDRMSLSSTVFSLQWASC